MNKKQDIIRVATQFFAKQRFNATTTLQIAQELNITEPAIFYHFKNKDDVFTQIFESAFSKLFSRLDALEKNTGTEFEKIENYISLFFEFAAEKPQETYLIVSACPTKLRDQKHVCSKNVEHFIEWGISYLSDCLENGIKKSEFPDIPIKDTASMFIALLNGIVRQKILAPSICSKTMKDTVVEFCRRSLGR